MRCRSLQAALAFAALTQSFSITHAQSIITTVAGSGRILTGVGGSALNVRLGNPMGVAVDSHGNVFVADDMQGVVFKITPTGTVTVFAGNGLRGFSGDGGPATAAEFLYPWALAVDAHDNVYISDYHNGRVRKVDAVGIITTVAGGGVSFDDGVPALSANLFEPKGLAVDGSGNLYIAEGGTSDVRKVTPDGTMHRIAGGLGLVGYSGDGGLAINASFKFPQGLALDAAGDLYIADRNNSRVRKIDENGIITTVAGNGQFGYSGDGGPATAAMLSFPSDVSVDSMGNLYIVDQQNNCIRKVMPSGIITTVAGSPTLFPPSFSGDGGAATEAPLNQPYGITVDAAGNLYVSDSNHRRIRKIDGSGTITTIAGDGMTNFSGDGGPAPQAAMDFPTDVKLDSLGNLFIADSMNHRVRKVTPDGTITTIAGNGAPGFSGDGGPAANAQLYTPVAVAVDTSGNVYISDSVNNRVRKVAPNGVISVYAGGGGYGYSGDGGPAVNAFLEIPAGLATDAVGNLYIADQNSNRIRKVSPAGIISTVAGNGNAGFSGDDGPAINAMLQGPVYVGVDSSGNLYFSDGTRRVRKVTANGIITTVASSGAFGLDTAQGFVATEGIIDYPAGVTADNKGNVYVYGGWQIYRVNPQGIISVLVGGDSNHEGFSGDGGLAAIAHVVSDTSPGSVPYVMGMTVDSSGNLYFADTGNDRIRKVTNVNGDAQIGISTADGYRGAGPNNYEDFSVNLYGNLSDSGPITQDVSITNLGTGALAWTAVVSTSFGGDWLSVSATSGTAPSTMTISASQGGLSPGLYAGTVMVSDPAASNSPRVISVLLTVPGPFVPASGGNGTVLVTEPADVGWSASSAADWITITSGTSGVGSGTVVYSVAPNTTQSQRTGSLSIADQTLLVFEGAGPAGNAPIITGVSNAASGQSGIVPDSFVSIYGSNFTSLSDDWSQSIVNGQLPTQLDGVSVSIGGKPAFINAITPSQINVQAPDLGSGSVQVIVTTPAGSSAPFTATVQQYEPAFFPWPNNQPVATHLDYSIAAENGTFPGTTTVPAEPGEVITLWGTGFGPVNPPVPAGQLPGQNAGASTQSPVTVTLNSANIQVLGSALSGYPGVYQIAVQIPATIANGDYPLVATINGVSSPQVTLSVHH